MAMDIYVTSPSAGITERRVLAGQKTMGGFLRCEAHENGKAVVCYLYESKKGPQFPLVGYGSPRLEIIKPLTCQLFPGKKLRCT
jgi:hypothetical protein